MPTAGQQLAQAVEHQLILDIATTVSLTKWKSSTWIFNGVYALIEIILHTLSDHV